LKAHHRVGGTLVFGIEGLGFRVQPPEGSSSRWRTPGVWDRERGVETINLAGRRDKRVIQGF
jgi:hypothetical protein